MKWKNNTVWLDVKRLVEIETTAKMMHEYATMGVKNGKRLTRTRTDRTIGTACVKLSVPGGRNSGEELKGHSGEAKGWVGNGGLVAHQSSPASRLRPGRMMQHGPRTPLSAQMLLSSARPTADRSADSTCIMKKVTTVSRDQTSCCATVSEIIKKIRAASEQRQRQKSHDGRNGNECDPNTCNKVCYTAEIQGPNQGFPVGWVKVSS